MKVGNLEEVLTFGAFKELTAANADMFRKEVHAAVNGHKVIEVDLSQTKFMDCSGLGALIALRNFARGRNGVMRLGESHPGCAATVRCRARRTHVRNRQHPADRPSPGSRATPPFNRPKRTQRWLDIKRELLSSHRLDRPHVTENRTEVHEFSRLVLCLVNFVSARCHHSTGLLQKFTRRAKSRAGEVRWVACHCAQVDSRWPLGSEESPIPKSQLVAAQPTNRCMRSGTAPA